jgi:regulator of protease activity HflC (stomatin/prohibitin superfamily)
MGGLSLPLEPLLCIGAFLILLILSGFRIVQEYERAIVFFVGRYWRTAGPGLYWIIPFFSTQRVIDIRTITVSIEPQETITRDSVTVKVNAVLWFRVTNPSRAVIGVADYRQAVYQAAMTALRNIVGQHDLDEVLRERDKMNVAVRAIVDRTSEPWGVEIETIEMKDVEIPVSMQRAMAQEAEAAREKRARIIKAEAELEASEKLAVASQWILANPAALELRRMQMIGEVGAEQNSTTVILVPSDFVSLAKNLSDMIEANNEKRKRTANKSDGNPQ